MRRRRWHIKAHAADRMRERVPGLKDVGHLDVVNIALDMLSESMPFGAQLGTDRMFAATHQGSGQIYVFVCATGEPGADYVVKSCLTMAQANANIARLVKKPPTGRLKRKLARQRQERERQWD